MSEINLINSEEEARVWFEKKKELNPEKVERHIRSFDEWMEGYDEDSEAFKEREPIYHYDDILFLQRHIRPEPYVEYILMNKTFVVDVDTNLDDFIILDFRGNVHKPTDADIEEIKEQIFKFFAVKNCLGLPIAFMEKDQTTFEIKGVEK